MRLKCFLLILTAVVCMPAFAKGKPAGGGGGGIPVSCPCVTGWSQLIDGKSLYCTEYSLPFGVKAFDGWTGGSELSGDYVLTQYVDKDSTQSACLYQTLGLPPDEIKQGITSKENDKCIELLKSNYCANF
jgi:hypothetical protein